MGFTQRYPPYIYQMMRRLSVDADVKMTHLPMFTLEVRMEIDVFYRQGMSI